MSTPNWKEFAAKLDSQGSSSVAIHSQYHKEFRRCSCGVDVKSAVELLTKAFGSPISFGNTPFEDAAERIYKKLIALGEAVASGRVSPYEFEELMMVILNDGHIDSHLAGQEMSGFSTYRILAERRGRQVAQAQVSFVRGFALALAQKDARYWDEVEGRFKTEPIVARTASYLGRTRGTAYDGFTVATPSNTLYDWRLGGVELHCTECPDLAAAGPWLKSEDTAQLDYPTLFTKPGECDTPCLYNCKCSLVNLASGAVGPAPFSFEEENDTIAA